MHPPEMGRHPSLLVLKSIRIVGVLLCMYVRMYVCTPMDDGMVMAQYAACRGDCLKSFCLIGFPRNLDPQTETNEGADCYAILSYDYDNVPQLLAQSESW